MAWCARKSFRYTTTPSQPTPEDLKEQDLLLSSSFQLLSRPEYLYTQFDDLSRLRNQYSKTTKPMLVWQPAPPYCTRANLEFQLSAFNLVDVCSLNRLELAALLLGEEATKAPFEHQVTERLAHEILETSTHRSGNGLNIVVGAGEHGCMTLSSSSESHWLPANHAGNSTKVIDRTGAGNTFLGAFTLILNQTGDIREAVIYGTVAASYDLEKFRLRTKSIVDGQQAWNGSAFSDRLEEYRKSRRHKPFRYYRALSKGPSAAEAGGRSTSTV